MAWFDKAADKITRWWEKTFIGRFTVDSQEKAAKDLSNDPKNFNKFLGVGQDTVGLLHGHIPRHPGQYVKDLGDEISWGFGETFDNAVGGPWWEDLLIVASFLVPFVLFKNPKLLL